MRRMADNYIPGLAQSLGLTYAAWAKTFNSDKQTSKGTAIGIRNRYIVSLGLISVGNNKSVGILIRYPETTSTSALQEELTALPALKPFRKTLKVGSSGVGVAWPYSWKKPKPEEVTAVVELLLATVAKHVAAFDGKCEDCHSKSASEVVLMNGMPGYHCAACQERVTEEKRRQQEEYRARTANYLLGLLAGVGMALLIGIFWGLVVGGIDGDGKTWSPKLHMLGGFVVGCAVSYVYFRAAGKVDRLGQGLAILLSVAGKWWGDAIYYGMIITHQHITKLTPALMSAVLRHFWKLKFSAEMSTLVFAADIGFSIMMAWMPWGKIPKFIPTFQPLAGSGQTTNAATA